MTFEMVYCLDGVVFSFSAGGGIFSDENSHLYKLISDIVNLKCPPSLITPAWSWTWPGWRLSGSTFPLC